MEKKTYAVLFVIAFILMTYYTYYNDVSIAQTIAGNGLEGVLWYFLSNFAYVFIFIGVIFFNQEKNLATNVVGAFMLVYAVDIISYPRFLSNSVGMDSLLLASSDGILMTKLVQYGLTYASAHYFYYFILPIALILGSIYILGANNFIKNLVGRR